MKSFANKNLTFYITATFYVAFAVMPFFVFGGYNIPEAFTSMFDTFPTNMFLYAVPAVFYLFIKKTNLSDTDKAIFTLCFDTSIIVLLYTALMQSRNTTLFSCIAFLILSVICINTNELLSALILLPGLLLFRLGLTYIFAAYIPVLFLLIMKYSASRKKEKSNPPFLLAAFLYITVLTAILLFSKKISPDYIHTSHNFTRASYSLNFAAGCVIIAGLCALFIARAVPILRNGNIAEKLAVIFTAVYPVIIIAISFFYNIISNEIKIVFTLCIMIMLCANLQLSLTYNDSVKPFITNKMKNSGTAILTAVIFCTFCFE